MFKYHKKTRRWNSGLSFDHIYQSLEVYCHIFYKNYDNLEMIYILVELHTYFVQQSPHWLHLYHDTKQAVPFMMNPSLANVYDGISPENVIHLSQHFQLLCSVFLMMKKVIRVTCLKGMCLSHVMQAQAIMFMAGNGSFIGVDNSSATRTQAPVPTPVTPNIRDTLSQTFWFNGCDYNA